MEDNYYLVMGMSITGMSLHDRNIANSVISFNISSGNDLLGSPLGTKGNITYFSNTTYPSFVNYWTIGAIGICPTNFYVLNETHCHCSPALNLTYDPVYSTHKCR